VQEPRKVEDLGVLLAPRELLEKRLERRQADLEAGSANSYVDFSYREQSVPIRIRIEEGGLHSLEKLMQRRVLSKVNLTVQIPIEHRNQSSCGFQAERFTTEREKLQFVGTDELAAIFVDLVEPLSIFLQFLW